MERMVLRRRTMGVLLKHIIWNWIQMLHRMNSMLFFLQCLYFEITEINYAICGDVILGHKYFFFFIHFVLSFKIHDLPQPAISNFPFLAYHYSSFGKGESFSFYFQSPLFFLIVYWSAYSAKKLWIVL